LGSDDLREFLRGLRIQAKVVQEIGEAEVKLPVIGPKRERRPIHFDGLLLLRRI
jgi:hypothetical protein